MNAAENLVNAFVGLPYQSSQHHAKLRLERQLHESSLQVLREQHADEIALEKKTYILSAFTDMEQYR
jgi:hypothetical protein